MAVFAELECVVGTGNAGFEIAKQCVDPEKLGQFSGLSACRHNDFVQRHAPGERLFVDYSGQTVPVIHPHTGEIRQAQHGYAVVIGILMRPPLLTVGFIFAFFVLDIAGWFVGQALQVFLAGMGGTQVGPIGFAAMLAVIISTMFLLCHPRS